MQRIDRAEQRGDQEGVAEETAQRIDAQGRELEAEDLQCAEAAIV